MKLIECLSQWIKIKPEKLPEGMALIIYEGRGVAPVELFLERLKQTNEGPQAIWQRFGNYSGKFGDLAICIEEKDKVVAVCDAGYDKRTKLTEVGIIIDPEHRGKGLSRLLIKEMRTELKRRGINQVIVYIDPKNERVQNITVLNRGNLDVDRSLGYLDRDRLPYLVQV